MHMSLPFLQSDLLVVPDFLFIYLFFKRNLILSNLSFDHRDQFK